MSTRILIVDDHDDLRWLIARFLEEEGFAVDEASNGAQALERMEANLPAVVLLDLTMPVLDGWTVRRRLLEDPRFARVPVVVISALHHPELPEAVSAFVPKPIDFDLLLEVVRRVGNSCLRTA